jgi:hypothetical protein
LGTPEFLCGLRDGGLGVGRLNAAEILPLLSDQRDPPFANRLLRGCGLARHHRSRSLLRMMRHRSRMQNALVGIPRDGGLERRMRDREMAEHFDEVVACVEDIERVARIFLRPRLGVIPLVDDPKVADDLLFHSARLRRAQ